MKSLLHLLSLGRGPNCREQAPSFFQIFKSSPTGMLPGGACHIVLYLEDLYGPAARSSQSQPLRVPHDQGTGARSKGHPAFRHIPEPVEYS